MAYCPVPLLEAFSPVNALSQSLGIMIIDYPTELLVSCPAKTLSVSLGGCLGRRELGPYPVHIWEESDPYSWQGSGLAAMTPKPLVKDFRL